MIERVHQKEKLNVNENVPICVKITAFQNDKDSIKKGGETE